jgi:flagellar motility protein MotE (MotC chaperone)
VNKKLIIIAAAGGFISFAGAFLTVWLVGRTHSPAPAQGGQRSVTADSVQKPNAERGTLNAGEAGNPTAQSQDGGSSGAGGFDKLTAGGEEPIKGLSAKQLKSLVFEVREKIREYEEKSKELEVRESRLQITQETLKKDIEELNRLKVDTATLVATLKEQRNRLLETRAVIEQSEKANLTAIAATYDKMDSASASKIINSMCAKQMEAGKFQGGAIDDAVRILYYMTERTKAKLLAEMVSSEPKLAALLCQRMKLISEGK